MHNPAGYVVYCMGQLRDGTEETAKVVMTLKQAETLIAHWAGGFGGENLTFRLFALGDEIPLRRVEKEVPQAPRRCLVYEVDTQDPAK